MLERTVEKRVCEYAQAKGWLTYKFTSPNRRSVPDRIFVSPEGAVVFIEFKAPGKLPTALQSRELRRLIANGANAFVVDDVPMGIQLVDRYVKSC